VFERFRVFLAIWLCKNTRCVVARGDQVEGLIQHAHDLAQYAQTSGGLNNPHRINAYKRVTRYADMIHTTAQSIATRRSLANLLPREGTHGTAETQTAEV
jgi:hypothetical protein